MFIAGTSTVVAAAQRTCPITAWLWWPVELAIMGLIGKQQRNTIYLAITLRLSAEEADRNDHHPAFPKEINLRSLKAAT